MITRSDFFKALDKGALWDVGVAINRTNPLPLDKFSVFGSLGTATDTTTETAMGYAKNSVIAYPGQIIAVVAGTNDAPTATVYVIKKTGTNPELETLGSSGDISAISTRVSTLETNAVTSAESDDAGINVTKAGNKLTFSTNISQREKNIIQVKDDGLYVPTPEVVTVPEYSIVKDATSSDFAAVYHLTKDNVNTGVAINIPKDKFLKSVTLEHYEAGSLPTGVTAPGTYLKFVFENITDPVYLNVNEFLDGVIYTGGTDSKGTEPNKYSTIQVNIDPLTHVITASILDGGIHTDELADSAVIADKIAANAVTEKKILNGAVTADKIAAGAVTETKIADNAITESKIKDGAVTLDKLSSGVQASLGNADSAIRKVKVNGTELTPDADKAVNVTVATGTANGHIAVNGIDVKVAGLGTAAYEAKGAFDAAGAAAAVLGNSETDTAESNTVHGVKKKAEANATAITGLQNGKVTKVDNTSIVHGTLYGETVGSQGKSSTKTYNIMKENSIIGTDAWSTMTTMEDGPVGKNYVPVYVAADGEQLQLLTGTPSRDLAAANKKYVDDSVNTAVSSGVTINKQGTGNIVTSVTKSTTSGKITVTNASTISINEVADLQTNLDAKANASDLTALQTTVAGKVDKYAQTSAPGQTTKIYAVDTTGTQLVLPVALTKGKDYEYNTQDPNGLAQYINNKLYSFTPTDSDNAYVVANKEYVDKVKTDLAVNAVHFKGVVETLPSSDELNNYSAGDIVILGTTKKEYILDNNKAWQEIGDESAYIPKNDNNIDNYLVDGSISQDKVNGLTTALANSINGAIMKDINGDVTVAVQNHILQIPVATDDTPGIVKSYKGDNGVYTSLTGQMLVHAITTDILKNGANTLILNCGGATL